MRIGLIDVDGHNFPNLALMKISAYHKARGDTVEWWFGDLVHYDIVYKSKIFSDEYSRDVEDPINADVVIKGGSGYCIHLEDGREVFDLKENISLPHEIESCFPDSSLYPQFNYSLCRTTVGCPRNCAFCHVSQKEGLCSKQVAELSDYWRGGTKVIKVLDANITACRNKRELFKDYAESGAIIDFTQGLDIRLLNDRDIYDINRMRLENIHFAWDDPGEDLTESFRYYAKKAKHHPHGSWGAVYVLTGFDSEISEDLFRIYRLRELGFDPFVMIYNKKNARQELIDLQQWCNNKIIFNKCAKFEEFDKRMKR